MPETPARRPLQSPIAREIDPWFLIGWLEGTLKAKGRLSRSDWNEAVDRGRARYQRDNPAPEASK